MKHNLKKLLAQMTPEEKIGQLVQVYASFLDESQGNATGAVTQIGLSADQLPTVGSVLNFHGAEEALRIQKKHLAEDRNKIPLLFMMDVIHGYKTIYPIPLALGASFNPALMTECAEMAAREASAGGIQVTFSPMVDLVRDARWGRVMETTGEDPYLNCVMGAAQVRGYQGKNVADHDRLAACVKHFAAYGGAEAGRDYNTVEISERLLRELYFPAYRACLDAGAKMVMTSFNSLNGVPATADKWLLHNLLRREWGFDEIVISDHTAVSELTVHGTAADFRDAAKQAFEAGVDIDMMSPAYCTELRGLVEDGSISEKAIDRAVLRGLKLKDELGLFDDPFHGASVEREKELCLSDAHRAIARRAAEESAVLLKNNGVLPLSQKTKSVALIGPFSDTHEVIGFWCCNGDNRDSVTVKEGVSHLLPNAAVTAIDGCSPKFGEMETDGMDAAVELAKNAETVILCLGELQYYSGEGNSRATLSLPGAQEELARRVLTVRPDAPILLFGGRPLELTSLHAIAPAILDVWYPGTEGGNAAANLLFGIVNPSGKVPMSFPHSVGQCPISYNGPKTGRPNTTPDDVHQPYTSDYLDSPTLPLYRFGYGLSYTTFSYEKMEMDRDTLTADESLTVRVTVKNTGNCAGKEVVQLYLHDLVASAVRPVQQLIGFEKILLQPGEEKTVMFRITEPMLRFVNAACKTVSEPGEFELFVGYANAPAIKTRFTLK